MPLIRTEDPRKRPRTCPLSSGQGHRAMAHSGCGPQSRGKGWIFGPARTRVVVTCGGLARGTERGLSVRPMDVCG